MSMKKIIKYILILLFLFVCLTGCSKGNIEDIDKNLKKIELTSNLVTYKAYYHNVIEYKKDKGTGLAHIFEVDRELFIEYSGYVKLGIDLSEVKIVSNGNQIDVYVPKAKIIGNPDVNDKNFTSENFYESKDSINKNVITGDDINEAIQLSKEEMKNMAENDKELLRLAENRAKAILAENIKQVVELSENKYSINWELEK